MQFFFYACDCGHEFKKSVPSEYNGGAGVPPTEEQLNLYASAVCPKCKKKTTLQSYLPHKTRGLFRIQPRGGQRGQYVTRL